eukprot:15467337-Alexandrium_andersonii.AAC.1
MACHPTMVRSAARTMPARAQGNTAGQAPQLSDSMCARQDRENVLYGERAEVGRDGGENVRVQNLGRARSRARA